MDDAWTRVVDFDWRNHGFDMGRDDFTAKGSIVALQLNRIKRLNRGR